MEARLAYQVHGLSKTYRGAPTPANIDIDLDAPAGEIFGLLGPNGGRLVAGAACGVVALAGAGHALRRAVDR